MEELNIRFQEIYSHGPFLKGGYYLVCNGIKQRNQIIKIQTHFSFHDALQCTSQQGSAQQSDITITPLRAWTTLKIQACKEDQYINLHMNIDLKKNMILLEINSSKGGLNSNLARIISCFGIKKGHKVFYLMDLNRLKVKHASKRYD